MILLIAAVLRHTLLFNYYRKLFTKSWLWCKKRDGCTFTDVKMMMNMMYKSCVVNQVFSCKYVKVHQINI